MKGDKLGGSQGSSSSRVIIKESCGPYQVEILRPMKEIRTYKFFQSRYRNSYIKDFEGTYAFRDDVTGTNHNWPSNHYFL